jgi:hypothetical protein
VKLPSVGGISHGWLVEPIGLLRAVYLQPIFFASLSTLRRGNYCPLMRDKNYFNIRELSVKFNKIYFSHNSLFSVIILIE